MRRMTRQGSKVIIWAARWEEDKRSVEEEKPETAQKMELRSKRCGGVAEDDMETQQSKV